MHFLPPFLSNFHLRPGASKRHLATSTASPPRALPLPPPSFCFHFFRPPPLPGAAPQPCSMQKCLPAPYGLAVGALSCWLSVPPVSDGHVHLLLLPVFGKGSAQLRWILDATSGASSTRPKPGETNINPVELGLGFEVKSRTRRWGRTRFIEGSGSRRSLQ